MNIELDKKLVNKYPKIFAERYLSMRESAMHWGFEHGDGWYWLLDNLCESIQSYIDNNKHLKIQQVVANQVKEKFGGLRFYYSGGNETIRGMINFAEDLSYRICERCGSNNNVLRTKGWIKTICKKCQKKEKLYNYKNFIKIIKHKLMCY